MHPSILTDPLEVLTSLKVTKDVDDLLVNPALLLFDADDMLLVTIKFRLAFKIDALGTTSPICTLICSFY